MITAAGYRRRFGGQHSDSRQEQGLFLSDTPLPDLWGHPYRS